MNEISSKNNSKIKDVVKLLNSSKKRSSSGLFVIEGLRLCVDAVKSGIKPVETFFTKECAIKSESEVDFILEQSKTSYTVPSDVFKAMSDTVSPQGIICVCETTEFIFQLVDNGKYVVLSNVADPANLGAISRAAEALGINGLIVCGGCDVYNPKALRASMGALFRLPIYSLKDENVFEFLKNNNIKSYASTPRTDSLSIKNCNFNGSCAIFIGNEANGLSEEDINSCDYKITIPMIGRAESLNAASAASILMYEMMRDEDSI